MGKPAKDLIGQQFGRLRVVGRIPYAVGQRNAFWRCICDCGRTTDAAGANLGKTTFSCGCLAKETARNLLMGNAHTRIHSMSHTPEHGAWLRMIDRCTNPNNHKFYRYGARGIVVCDRWRHSFQNFYADMGPRPSANHSLDRINNDGPYSPENCRWATAMQQAANRGNARMITVNGVTMHLAGWCRALGINQWKVYELTNRKNGTPPRFESVEAMIEAYQRSRPAKRPKAKPSKLPRHNRPRQTSFDFDDHP